MTSRRGGLPSLGRTQNHYETLGVERSASPQDIRRAYRGLARQLHPDRHQQSAPPQAEVASRRMSDINAAWAVLSNPAAKDLYDLELRLATARADGPSPVSAAPRAPQGGRGTPPPAWTAGDGLRFAGPDDAPPRYLSASQGHPAVRGVLWILVLGVLAAIFVFTAYAAQGGEDGDGRPSSTTTVLARLQAGDCVDELAGAMDLVTCNGPHDSRVLDVVPIGRPCPSVSREVYLPDQQETACLGAG